QRPNSGHPFLRQRRARLRHLRTTWVFPASYSPSPSRAVPICPLREEDAMSLRALLRSWRRRFDRRGRSTPATFRPRAEQLESRELLSGSTFHFDFGTATSPVCPGCLGVAPSAAYNPTRGYGWQNNATIKAIDRLTKDPLTRDFHQSTDATFLVDLPNGTYD